MGRAGRGDERPSRLSEAAAEGGVCGTPWRLGGCPRCLTTRGFETTSPLEEGEGRPTGCTVDSAQGRRGARLHTQPMGALGSVDADRLRGKIQEACVSFERRGVAWRRAKIGEEGRSQA
ncbi:hypothetical protein E2562_020971 [Oryza meyeriana var. granulata]|uniref:Uncharacterized protein n=1 Tax=Oryza meyeriana var. granulata TaxID=110450 RepID=A0A6G1DYM1_9ORYZ|nr:hypothetical protein E2562_020971 [Oryza meyeriana var. granulata]